MISYSYVRAVIRTSACVAAALAAPLSFGADAAPQQAQAQLLDQANFPCTNCFFGASRYYYCFEVGKQILVGYQRTRVLNWEDNTKNYLTFVNPRWETWNAPGATVPILYDDKHIWVSRADEGQVKRNFWAHLVGVASRSEHKQVRLTRSSMRDIFVKNDLCRGSDVGKAR
jgi:hypothetical protein